MGHPNDIDVTVIFGRNDRIHCFGGVTVSAMIIAGNGIQTTAIIIVIMQHDFHGSFVE